MKPRKSKPDGTFTDLEASRPWKASFVASSALRARCGACSGWPEVSKGHIAMILRKII